MKNIQTKIREMMQMGGAVSLLTLFIMASASTAQAFTCKVNKKADTAAMTAVADSLRSVIKAFNMSPLLQGCKNIEMAVDKVTLESPLEITGVASAESKFVFDGKGNQIEIDKSKLDKFPGGCAIHVLTSNVEIKNLHLLNGGICIGKDDAKVGADGKPATSTVGAIHNITIEDVRVENNTKGDGIKIAANTETVTIGKGTKLLFNEGYGLNFLGTMEAKGDNIHAFTDVGGKDVIAADAVTLFHNKGAVKTASFSDISIKNIIITKGSIRGQVVKCDKSGKCTGAPAERVLVHRTNSSGSGLTDTSLIADVSKVPLNGLFTIKVPTTLLNDKGDYISLVPVWSVAAGLPSTVYGSSTDPVQVKFDPNNIIFAVDSGISPITGPGQMGGSKLGFANYEECKAGNLAFGGNTADKGLLLSVDSDDDGIFDAFEDRNHNCMRDFGETDWNDPDTDDDGILDGEEDTTNNGYVDCYRPTENESDKDAISIVNPKTGDAVIAIPLSVAKDVDGIPCAYQQDATVTPPGCENVKGNVIGSDGRPVGFDPATDFCTEMSPVSEGGFDTDGDGRSDGIELRTLNYSKLNKGHLWKLHGKEAVGSFDTAGKFVHEECDAGDIGRRAIKLIKQGKHKTVDASGAEVEVETQFAEWRLCISKGMEMSPNFSFSSVKQLSFGQTNPFNPDSDGDGFCDGSGGVGCASLKFGNVTDKCPTNKKEDNKCTEACVPGGIYTRIKPEMLQTVKDAVADFASMGDKLKLETVLNSAYEKGTSWDLDGDKIPDIVEDPQSKCDFNSTDVLATNPYTDDSDGDGKKDKTDPCPTDSENKCLSDQNAGGAQLCATFVKDDIFTMRKAMYCYLDWDDDGLFNCEENLNFDNKVDSNEGETCPAQADSEKDGLDDYKERLMKSNPWKKNSDGDSLDDAKEVIVKDANGKDVFQSQFQINSSAGCANAGTANANYTQNVLQVTVASDPSKSDTDADGLNDDIERSIGTNPLNPDSDGDGLCDGNPKDEEVRDATGKLICVKGEVLSNDGTFPHISRNVSPSEYDSAAVAQSLKSSQTMTLSNGHVITASNPCDKDTDHDGKDDWIPGLTISEIGNSNIDPVKNNRNLSATSPGMNGVDSDLDGIPDDVENNLGTQVNDADSDDDGLEDGCVNVGQPNMRGELCKHFTSASTFNLAGLTLGHAFNAGVGDTDPLNADTDFDGMKDGDEIRYPDGFFADQNPAKATVDGSGKYLGMYRPNVNLDPTSYDTDGDGILDGVESGATFKAAFRADDFYCGTTGRQAVIDGGLATYGTPKYTAQQTYAAAGVNPLNPEGTGFDTDGDSLQDGNMKTYIAPGIGKAGEDLNCDGKVSLDKDNHPKELDPRIADTNSDGLPDGAAICQNGLCDVVTNLPYGYARQASGGCSNTLMPGTTMPATATDLATLAMMLAPMAAALRMRFRRKK